MSLTVSRRHGLLVAAVVISALAVIAQLFVMRGAMVRERMLSVLNQVHAHNCAPWQRGICTNVSSDELNGANLAAQQTGEAVQELAQATDRIGTVVLLINGIAGQASLLALNAKIEPLAPARLAGISRWLPWK